MRKVLIALILSGIAAAAILSYLRQNAEPWFFERTGGNIQFDEQEKMQRAMLSYMANPLFTGADFAQQITGTQAEHELLNLNEGMVYFSLDAEENLDATLARLTAHPDQIESALLEGGGLVLGDYVYNVPGRHFFRFPATDFLVDETAVVSIDLSSAVYNVSVRELTDLIMDRTVYGGNDFFETVSFLNHAKPIAKPGEPSLMRLLAQIVTPAASPERQAQEILDFVHRAVEYDGREALLYGEVLKRPSEVLMSGGSDCSGLVILYASLLEQAAIEYKLLYMELDGDDLMDHIAVAVAGDFSNQNGMGFTLDGEPYTIAETTAAGFVIGQSRVEDYDGLEEIRYFQRPGQWIADAQTGESIQ
jgi:hypothetical protein